MATPVKSISAYPDAKRAFQKFVEDGPYELPFSSLAAATAFRHRCHTFRRKFSDLCDETGSQNPYAMCVIRLRSEDNTLEFDRREDPLEQVLGPYSEPVDSGEEEVDFDKLLESALSIAEQFDDDE